MVVLVTVETLLLALLALLVAGLLRSHAEILRRLEGRADEVEQPRPAVAREGGSAAPDILGATLAGEPIKIGIANGAAGTLIAFLTSGCSVCGELWAELAPDVRPVIPGGARLVVVTKDSAYESPSKLLELAPRDLPVVMSSAAWEAYAAPGAPYFVYVDGLSGEIQGEGVARSWEQVLSLLRDALADAGSVSENGNGSAGRALRAEGELAAAGIGPGHPSLYPRARGEH